MPASSWASRLSIAAFGSILAVASAAPGGGTKTAGLVSEDGGQIVYDSAQNIHWLANANLAGEVAVRRKMGVTGVNADGTMDYATALKWVDALNNYDNGPLPKGYLKHSDWQLPTTPLNDETCSVLQGPASGDHGSFGASCTQSALGNLYSYGLRRVFPDSVVSGFGVTLGPLTDLQPTLYWTAATDPLSGGKQTFSFNTRVQAANTTKYNYLYVLPMLHGKIIGETLAGAGPLVPYTNGKAVYQASKDISWATDANLPGKDRFGINRTTAIREGGHRMLTVPLINPRGAMLFAETGNDSGEWLAALNASRYAGSDKWQLPDSSQELLDLNADLLSLQPGGASFKSNASVGPFQNLQPFLYWACQRDQTGNSTSPCNSDHPGYSLGSRHVPMRWTYNFDTGFQGTAMEDKQFNVMVYYPDRTRHPSR